MWKIIKNEWLYFSRTRWLTSLSLGFIIILIGSILLGHLQTKEETERFTQAKNELRADWENIDAMNPHSAAHYGTYVFKPANLLSSLDEGVNSTTGNVLRVEGHVQNEIVHSEASQMQTVSKFGKLKSSLLLQYIIPILLIFLAFNSINNEKQSGRLKLLVLQGARPVPLVFAKTLSIWLFGITLLVLTIFAYAVFNTEALNFEILSRTGLFFLAYALYYFIITGLSVFFSARWQNSSVALTSMLGIWIIWTIFLPNILMSSVEKWHELPSRNEFKAEMKEDRSKGIDGHNPADERGKQLEQLTIKEYGVDSLSQLPINFDGLRMQADEEYGNQVWDKHFGNLREVLNQQKQKYQLGGIFNPFISLQNASMGFAGNDNLHHQEFLVDVESYRRDFIKMLNDEHAYGGSKTGDWGWKANNDFFKSVPDFKYNPTALASVFPHYSIDLLLLSIWTIVVVGLMVIGTRKMQIL